ncbi:MAG: AAA family ATPase [Chromatiales bacterium]|nr:AAA family ATPase [Chromatiales bacterium]
MQRFPYGIADFAANHPAKKVISTSTAPTALPLIEDAGKQLLFLRPRRFGKSLWLSTLENYYDLARADDFERLFGGLKIGQNPTPLHNRYFVLKLNFSVVDPSGDRRRDPRAPLFNHHQCPHQGRHSSAIGDWLDGRVECQPGRRPGLLAIAAQRGFPNALQALSAD